MLLAREHPYLAANMTHALAALKHVTLRPTAGLVLVPEPTGTHFSCGPLTVGFDSRGALTTLADKAGGQCATGLSTFCDKQSVSVSSQSTPFGP